MLRTNYWCVYSPNISVDVAKSGQNCHKFILYTHFISVTENDLSWQKNLFMVIFQLMRMFSYAKNKLQMCSVNQHQCRRRKMWGKFSQIHPVHSHFVCYKKLLVLTEQSIHGNFLFECNWVNLRKHFATSRWLTFLCIRVEKLPWIDFFVKTSHFL